MKYDANRLGNGKKTMTAEQIEQYVEENAGAAYTAGDGISITDNVISVDNTEIQEKLTAGNGISILDNVISSTNGAVQVPYTEWNTLVEEVDSNHFKFKSDVIITNINESSAGALVSSLYYPKNGILLKSNFAIPTSTNIQSNSFNLSNWFANYSSFINTESSSLSHKRVNQQFIKGTDENTFTLNYSSSNDTISKSVFTILKLN